MTEKPRFCDREIKETYHWMLRQLSSTCFVLAGFSFTSLSLFVGFYRWQLEIAGEMISPLLVCSIFFLVSGEFAREAYKVWEYLLAEGVYLATTGGLLITFLLFVLRALPRIQPLAILIMCLGIVFFLAKAANNIKVTYRIR